MVKITFPDGSEKEYKDGITGFEIATSISERLAQEVLSVTVGQEVWDINRPINTDSAVKLHKWDDDEGKHAFWHSSAHLMAEVLELMYPGMKFGIGPAIENGFYYDVELPEGKTLSDRDFPAIESKMLELAREKRTFERREVSKDEALQFFGEKGDQYKIELIEELEEGTITLYKQGNFTDLCRGPHLPDTGFIKAVKLLSIAGAYWRGDEKNIQLTRIYGITFPKKKMLDEYLVFLEEAQKRDHRKIGREMDLFTFSRKTGLGLPLWLPKGNTVRERLIKFMKDAQVKAGYEFVSTPHIGQKELWVTSGHYDKYGESSFRPITTPVEGEEFLLKPMNCPHHCEIYKSRPRSYKDLPIRYAEFGTVYRYEQSGELHGLTRVRGFTQDDAHIFCTNENLKDEFKGVIDLILYVFKALDFKDYIAQISLRGDDDKDNYIGTDENWEKAEKAIIEATEEKGLNAKIEYGEAAFYGPKLDFMVKDAIGREWQLGTIQIDYNLPERFELEYMGSDNLRHRPIMIHRAPFGSLERFVAILIEHTAGKFPLWLTPEQVVVLPISEKYNDYGKKVLNLLNNYDIRTVLDERNEKIGKKIRDNELRKIPYLLIVGEKEAGSNKVSLRKQGEGDKGVMDVQEFIDFIKNEVNELLASYN